MSAGLLAIVNAVLPGFLTVCVFRLIAPRTEGTGTMLVATALAWNVVINALVQCLEALKLVVTADPQAPSSGSLSHEPLPDEAPLWISDPAVLLAHSDDWSKFFVAIVLGFLAAKVWSSSRIHRWLRRLRVTDVGPHARIDVGMFKLAEQKNWASVIHVKEEDRPIYGKIHSWSIQDQGGGIGVRTRRRDKAMPDQRYQDTRTVEHVYLPLQEVRKVEFVDPNPTKEASE